MMTLKECEARLGKCESTIRHYVLVGVWMKEGDSNMRRVRLPMHRNDCGRWMFKEAEVEKWASDIMPHVIPRGNTR